MIFVMILDNQANWIKGQDIMILCLINNDLL